MCQSDCPGNHLLLPPFMITFHPADSGKDTKSEKYVHTPQRGYFCAADSKEGISSCYQFCEHPKQHKEKEPQDQQSANYFLGESYHAVKKKKRHEPTRLNICLLLRRGCELCLASVKTFCGYLSVLCCNSVIST